MPCARCGSAQDECDCARETELTSQLRALAMYVQKERAWQRAYDAKFRDCGGVNAQ